MKCQPVNVNVLVNVCQHIFLTLFKSKVIFLINSESSKYIAKLFSLSINYELVLPIIIIVGKIMVRSYKWGIIRAKCK